MPMTHNNDRNGDPCQGLSVRLVAAGARLAGTFFTGGTSGKVTAATTVHAAHNAEAVRLIQKNVA
ncbi:hypothetical protein D3C84_1256590 [compost metagenome]